MVKVYSIGSFYSFNTFLAGWLITTHYEVFLHSPQLSLNIVLLKDKDNYFYI